MASNRPDLNKSRWQTMRKQARMRDGNRCRNCGATAKLSVHHIVKARNGGRDTLDNLVTLCASCHRRADAKPKAVFSGEGVTSRASGENTSPIHPFGPSLDDISPNRPQSRQW
jgi:5-methylcytosine-specific restriction endonuclease McrA